jgi:thymidylate synthase ThyX
MPAEFQAVPQDVIDILNKFPENHAADEYQAICKSANDWYQTVVASFKTIEAEQSISNPEMKRLREFFRGVLPQNNMTERVTTMNLRSFANYQKLRNSEHAQPEIRQVAKLMLEAVKASGVAPIALAALEANGWTI